MSDRAEALQAELGAGIVSLHDPVKVAGAVIRVSLRPRDADELARSLAALHERERPVLVRGGGTRMDFGNPPREGVETLLSTEGLAGVRELDALDGVVNVGAGTPLASLEGEVLPAGWELPLDPPGATTTVGGALATAATGPRRLRFGAPRDCILGLTVVLASGERTRCGARVVKNVTGYDMAKLYAGSLGVLGVIESAWLRLRPRPEETRTQVALLATGSPDESLRLALEASRRDSARAVALVTGACAEHLGAPAGAPPARVLVAEYAGDSPAVARDCDWLRAESGARTVPDASRLVGRLRDLQGSGRVRARLAVLPDQQAALCAPLVAAGLGTVVYPGVGLVYAIQDEERAGAAREAAAVIDAAAAANGADLVFEALPAAESSGRDVFGDPGATGPLSRSLKQRFDPRGILNPGRFQGRL